MRSRRALKTFKSVGDRHRVSFPRLTRIEIDSIKALAIEALRSAKCLSFKYDGCERVVEVHTVGITTAGRDAICAYQVAGDTNSEPLPGWRLFCIEECIDVQIYGIASQGPRPEHRKGAKQFRVIYAEL